VTATFTILGTPRTKKNSPSLSIRRVTRFRRGKLKTRAIPVIRSNPNSKKWEESAKWQLANQWRRSPLEGPVEVTARVFRERAAGDLINYLQAIADALERAKVLVDDVQIVSWDGSRLDKDASRPRVELTVKALEVAP